MENAIKTNQVGSVTVKIIPDDSGSQECPLDSLLPDEGIKWVSFEKKSTLSNYHNFKSPEEAKSWAKTNQCEVYPLFKYEHSGVAYSTKSFIGRAHHAEWDSGQCGFIFIKKSVFKRRYAGKNLNEIRGEIAESWCKTVTTWCNGDYYGYVIENKDGDQLDSCWGFDDADYCETEAMSSAKHYSGTILTEEVVQVES